MKSVMLLLYPLFGLQNHCFLNLFKLPFSLITLNSRDFHSFYKYSSVYLWTVGNIKEIHEANCIPTRNFEQILRYWRWYVTDLTKVKGFVLNYNMKGKLNNLRGKEWNWSDDEEEDDNSTGSDDEGSDESTVASDSQPSVQPNISEYIRNNEKTEPNNEPICDGILTILNYNTNGNDELSRNDWTSGEEQKLAVGYAAYGFVNSDDLTRYDFYKLSEFMNSRNWSEVEMYMKSARNARKIHNFSKNLLSHRSKSTYRKEGSYASSLAIEKYGELCEAFAIYGNNPEMIEIYMLGYCTQKQIEGIIEEITSSDDCTFIEDTEFDLTSPLMFPVQLFHVLNISPHCGFDHIISWTNWNDCHCNSFKIHDKGRNIPTFL